MSDTKTALPPPGPKGFESEDDPHRLAGLLVDRHRHGGVAAFAYWKGSLWQWSAAGACYREIGRDNERATVTAHCKSVFDDDHAGKLLEYQSKAANGEADPEKDRPPKPRKVTTALVSNVQQALHGMALVGDDVGQPCWRDGRTIAAADVLPARNGLAYLPDLIAGNDTPLIPPTPAFFAAFAVDFDIDQEAPEPVQWKAFLHGSLDGDPERIGVLQEWFGYCLTLDTSAEKMLWLIGKPRAGKGTVLTVLRELVGRHGVAALTLASLATNFGMASMLGKPVALIGDARVPRSNDAGTIVERLLSITGRDPVPIDRKYRDALSVVLPTKITVATNEVPRVLDPSGALASRFLIVNFERSFLGKEDHDLKDRLLDELPGILLWAAEGLRRLRERGRFVQPSSGEDYVGDLIELSSPITAFVGECCVVGADKSVPCDDLYRVYRDWCERSGQHVASKPTFGKDLRSALSIRRTQRRRQGEPTHMYIGVRQRHPHEPMGVCETAGDTGDTGDGNPQVSPVSPVGDMRRELPVTAEQPLSQGENVAVTGVTGVTGCCTTSRMGSGDERDEAQEKTIGVSPGDTGDTGDTGDSDNNDRPPEPSVNGRSRSYGYSAGGGR